MTDERSRGLAAGIAACALWRLLPLHRKLLSTLPDVGVVALRVMPSARARTAASERYVQPAPPLD